MDDLDNDDDIDWLKSASVWELTEHLGWNLPLWWYESLTWPIPEPERWQWSVTCPAGFDPRDN